MMGMGLGRTGEHAEANGYFVRPYQFTDVMVGPALQRLELEGSLPIVSGPGYQLIKDGEQLVELYSVAAMLPDRRLGLLFYGDTASKRMQSPTVRLYVPQQPYPVGTSGITAFNDPSFRDNALVFEGNWASDGCMGAPCYDFPEILLGRIEQHVPLGWPFERRSACPCYLTDERYRRHCRRTPHRNWRRTSSWPCA